MKDIVGQDNKWEPEQRMEFTEEDDGFEDQYKLKDQVADSKTRGTPDEVAEEHLIMPIIWRATQFFAALLEMRNPLTDITHSR